MGVSQPVVLYGAWLINRLEGAQYCSDTHTHTHTHQHTQHTNTHTPRHPHTHTPWNSRSPGSSPNRMASKEGGLEAYITLRSTRTHARTHTHNTHFTHRTLDNAGLLLYRA